MKDKIIIKINSLLNEVGLFQIVLNEQKQNWSDTNLLAINQSKFSAFTTATLSFLNTILGKENFYFLKFKNGVQYFEDYNLVLAAEILNRIKVDVEEGWLNDIKSILSAELFTDFLEMAEYLLEESYKDAAAVIIGSVLEENLRTLCITNKINLTTTDPQTQKTKTKKAETLNTDLCKNQVYNLSVQKAVTSWLEIRNNAAHGKYNQYDLAQVKHLLQAVIDFTSKYI